MSRSYRISSFASLADACFRQTQPSRRKKPSRAGQYESLEKRALLAAYPAFIGGELTFGDADASAPYGVENTFRLETLPDADFTIALDFTGHLRGADAGGDQREFANWPAFNTDNVDPDGFDYFTDEELAEIQRLWQGVAEDFAPFNINVTTVETPADKIIQSGPNDTTYGYRVLMSQRANGNRVGGYADFSPADFSREKINVVFNRDSTTVSHELGHSFILYHAGTAVAPGETPIYYQRQIGTGATAFTPIMGSAFSSTGGVTQWSNGNYVGARDDNRDSGFFDQIAVIGAQAGFRADDHGNATASATPLKFDGEGLSSEWGFIDTRQDEDFFSFTSTGGNIEIEVTPFLDNPNLDSSVTLWRVFEDSGAQWVATDSPESFLVSGFSTTLSAGNYVLVVDGVKGPNNTSDYGSLGFYNLDVRMETDRSVDFGAQGTIALLHYEDNNVIVGDFNGDGLDDFIRQEKGTYDDDDINTAQLKLSQGNGNFTTTAVDWQYWLKGDLTNLYVGDFDGDGKDDFLRQEKGAWDNDGVNTLMLFRSTGSNFERSVISDASNDAILKGDSSVLHVGDFNGDGKDDFIRQGFAEVPGQDWAHMFLSTGDGFAFSAVADRYLRGDRTNIHVGDFNNDGADDFVLQEKAEWDDNLVGNARYFRSRGDATFAIQELPDLASVRGDETKFHVGDFNGDGRDDILRQELGYIDGVDGNTASIFFSDGANFSQTLIPAGDRIPGDRNRLTVGDFNGDGKDDFVRQGVGALANDATNSANLWISQGDGSFQRQGDFRDLRGDETRIHVADLDGDGSSDLIRQEGYFTGRQADAYFSRVNQNSNAFTVDVKPNGQGRYLTETGSGTISIITGDDQTGRTTGNYVYTQIPSGGMAGVGDNGLIYLIANGDFSDLELGESRTTWVPYEVVANNGVVTQNVAVFTVNGIGSSAQDDRITVGADYDSQFYHSSLISNDLIAPGETVEVIMVDGQTDAVNRRYFSPSGGRYYVSSDGRVGFNPLDDFNHLDPGEVAATSITYTLRDSAGRTSEATLTVTVTGRGPNAWTQRITVDEDFFSNNYLLNVFVKDGVSAGSDLKAISIDGTEDSIGVRYQGLRGGTFYLSENGWLGFVTNGDAVPDQERDFDWLGDGQSTSTWITYTIEDAAGFTSTATVMVTVNGKGAPLPIGEDGRVVGLPARWSSDGDGQVLFSESGEGSADDQGYVHHHGHSHDHGHSHEHVDNSTGDHEPGCTCEQCSGLGAIASGAGQQVESGFEQVQADVSAGIELASEASVTSDDHGSNCECAACLNASVLGAVDISGLDRFGGQGLGVFMATIDERLMSEPFHQRPDLSSTIDKLEEEILVTNSSALMNVPSRLIGQLEGLAEGFEAGDLPSTSDEGFTDPKEVDRFFAIFSDSVDPLASRL